MRSISKLLARLALVLVALVAFTAPALAAAPSNDTFGNAKLVTIGFSDIINTTEATTDGNDKQLLKSCPAPATDASVWYTIIGDGTKVAVDVGNSSYSADVIVATLSHGSSKPSHVQMGSCRLIPKARQCANHHIPLCAAANRQKSA